MTKGFADIFYLSLPALHSLANKVPKSYTKTEIKRMSTADLKKLAKELDIEEADTYTGADLKKLLVDKLGL